MKSFFRPKLNIPNCTNKSKNHYETTKIANSPQATSFKKLSKEEKISPAYENSNSQKNNKIFKISTSEISKKMSKMRSEESMKNIS